MSSPVATLPPLTERVASSAKALPFVGPAFSILSNAYDRFGRNSSNAFVRQSVATVETRVNLQGRHMHLSYSLMFNF